MYLYEYFPHKDTVRFRLNMMTCSEYQTDLEYHHDHDRILERELLRKKEKDHRFRNEFFCYIYIVRIVGHDKLHLYHKQIL